MFKTTALEKATPADLLKASKRFEWLTTFMVCEFKFIHQILMMMNKIAHNGLGTFGVRVTDDGKFELRYDPCLFMNLTDAELTFVFYHEVLHLALHHCTKRPLTTDPKARMLANMAHDLAINELIPVSASCQRPVGEDGKIAGIFVDELKKKKEYADIEPMQSSEWYYDYLRKKDIENGGDGTGCGSCDGDCANCKAGKAEGGGGMRPKKDCPKFDDHGEWKEHELADDKVTAKVKEVDRNGTWGDVSQGVRDVIMAAQIKKINWRNKIRVWFGNLAWKDKSTTRKKPNRRTGYIHPGYRRSYVDKYLVAADTSGSCFDQETLGQWIGVLNQLVETLPVDFMQFDCSIQTEPKPYDRRKLKLEFKGQGGTSFQPIIDLVDKCGYKGLMILTDGEAAPPTRPKRAHVLWVLPVGCNPPVDWGDKVHLVKHS